jgi:hypothetical protein
MAGDGATSQRTIPIRSTRKPSKGGGGNIRALQRYPGGTPHQTNHKRDVFGQSTYINPRGLKMLQARVPLTPGPSCVLTLQSLFTKKRPDRNGMKYRRDENQILLQDYPRPLARAALLAPKTQTFQSPMVRG